MIKINHFHLAKYNSYSIYQAHECSDEFLVTWNHWSSLRCSLILHHFSLRKWFIHFFMAYLRSDYYLFHSFFKCVFFCKKNLQFLIAINVHVPSREWIWILRSAFETKIRTKYQNVCPKICMEYIDLFSCMRLSIVFCLSFVALQTSAVYH